MLYVSKRPATWQIVIDAHTETPRAIRTKQGELTLNATAGDDGLLSTTNRQAVRQLQAELTAFSGRQIDLEMLRLPPEVAVKTTHNLLQATEADLLGDVFSRPVETLYVNDRYLLDEERIVNRLGAYLRLAGASLQSVKVRSYPASKVTYASLEEQTRAIEKLQHTFPDVEIDFKRTEHAEHDRFIILERVDGTQARILIGKGLDFIKSDGSVAPTYIVIEDPYRS